MTRRPVDWKRFLKPVVIAGTLLVAGCSALGYRVGSSLPPGINVVHVPTLVNRTAEPQLELGATQAVIRELQREGTLTVGDMGKADVVLLVILEDFSMEPLRYESDSPTATSEYRLTIHAALELKSRQDGRLLASNKVRGEADFVPAGDLSSAKREALPQAAADLAHRIVKSVVEFW